MGLFFVLGGIGMTGGQFAATALGIEMVGLPMPRVLTCLTIFIELIAGSMLIIGYKTRYAASALIGFTVLATWFFHLPTMWWSLRDVMGQVMFMKNLAIVGGLMHIVAYGSCQHENCNRFTDDKK